MKLSLRIRTSLLAVRILRRRMGIVRMSKLLWRVATMERRGEPWRELGPPASDAEKVCRSQAGRVILLFDLLLEQMERDEALDLLEAIVSEAGVVHLRDALPRLDRASYDAMPQSERERILEDALAQFPNATIGEVELTPDRFRYEITRCEFVELCSRVGRRDLAPLFCSGDGLYFERYLTDVDFERPETLAEGGGCCDFRFRWKAEE